MPGDRRRRARPDAVRHGAGRRSGTEPASLVGAVLDEESRRQADAAAADSEVAVDVATLPGVGGDAVTLRAALDRDRRRLLVTVGAMWGLGLAIFAMTAILAIKIAHDYGWSFRFLVQVAILPGFTIVLVSQPLGNYVDRVTTNRPRVMRWMLALSVVALAAVGRGVLPVGVPRRARVHRRRPAGDGSGADLPARRHVPGARPPDVFAAYMAMGATGFVIGPLLVVFGVERLRRARPSGGRPSSWLAALTAGARVRRRPPPRLLVGAVPRWRRSSTTTATSAPSGSPRCTRSLGSGRSRRCGT